MPALDTSRDVEKFSSPFPLQVVSTTGPDGHLWVAYRRRLPAWGAALVVAERTKEGWVRRESGLEDVLRARSPDLVVDGGTRPTLAWTGEDGVEVRQFRGGTWRRVSDEPMWDGPAGEPALTWRRDGLCVAFSAPTSTTQQIGVRCLRSPPSEP